MLIAINQRRRVILKLNKNTTEISIYFDNIKNYTKISTTTIATQSQQKQK